MSASDVKGNWFGRHYEKLLLPLTAAALAGTLGIHFMKIGALRSEISDAYWKKLPAQLNDAKPVDSARVEAGLKELGTDPRLLLGKAEDNLFVSEVRFSALGSGFPLAWEATVDPFTGQKQPQLVGDADLDSDGDGMTDLYEKENGFDPFVAADALQDTDGDGFTNVEEFRAGTDPRDKNSTPPYIIKMRVVKIINNPFKLLFKSVTLLPDGKKVFALNTRDGGRTHFKALDEEVDGFVIKAYEREAPAGETLVLQQGPKEVRLVRGKVRQEFEVKAGLINLVDGSKSVKRIRETIELPDGTYTVMEILDDDTVSVKDVESGKLFVIPQITQEERSGLVSGRAVQPADGFWPDSVNP